MRRRKSTYKFDKVKVTHDLDREQVESAALRFIHENPGRRLMYDPISKILRGELLANGRNWVSWTNDLSTDELESLRKKLENTRGRLEGLFPDINWKEAS